MKRAQQLQKMKGRLLKRRAALLQTLSSEAEMLEGIQKSQGDEIDYAVDTAQGEISSQLAEAEGRELRSIEEALERMREGSYGLCEHCESKIPLARLQAIPHASSCIACQRQADRTSPRFHLHADFGWQQAQAGFG